MRQFQLNSIGNCAYSRLYLAPDPSLAARKRVLAASSLHYRLPISPPSRVFKNSEKFDPIYHVFTSDHNCCALLLLLSLQYLPCILNPASLEFLSLTFFRILTLFSLRLSNVDVLLKIAEYLRKN